MNFSNVIEAFLRTMDDAMKDYKWANSQREEKDKLTQDLLHKLELDGLNYSERAKVATALARCRQERRACKDTVEILEPLVSFLESEKGKQCINLVREALGKTRKVEERMKTRRYYPRVLKEDE